jgi:hypothetical protein
MVINQYFFIFSQFEFDPTATTTNLNAIHLFQNLHAIITINWDEYYYYC